MTHEVLGDTTVLASEVTALNGHIEGFGGFTADVRPCLALILAALPLVSHPVAFCLHGKGGGAAGGAEEVLRLGRDDDRGLLGKSCQLTAILPAESPTVAVEVAGRISVAVISDALAVIRGQQVLPIGIFVCVGVGGRSVREGLDISDGIVLVRVAVGIGCFRKAADCAAFRQELSLIIIGELGDVPYVVRSRQNIAGLVIGVGIARKLIGIAVSSSGIVNRGNLRGRVGPGSVPVGVALGERSTANSGETAQLIIAISELGQLISVLFHGEGVQRTVRGIVGAALRVGIAADLPAFLYQLIVSVVNIVGVDHGRPIHLFLAVDQSAKGIVVVQIGSAAAVLCLRQAVEASFAIVNVGLGAAQLVVGKGNAVAIGEALLLQQTVSGPIGVGRQ